MSAYEYLLIFIKYIFVVYVLYNINFLVIDTGINVHTGISYIFIYENKNTHAYVYKYIYKYIN